ncbi:MAG: methyltransferase domain-containing protein [Ignavibacteriales bacterium]|nr:methyltransferase domain-containing protein [Ignavibacteriales bacterium]
MPIVAPTANKEELRNRIFSAVQDMYTEVASCPTKTFHFPTGRWACEFVGYPAEELDAIPTTAVESFAGVGYPFKGNIIRPGDRVLDIGCGSGTDILIAALKVGPSGQVLGLDMTDAMLEKAQLNIERAHVLNVQVIQGNAESILQASASVDVVTSNGVLNLSPDKKAAFAEIYRVLKRGGRIQISDIVLKKEISEKSRMNPQLWAECIVGAVPYESYLELVRSSGFEDVRVIDTHQEYFEKSPSDSTKNAAHQYGAIAITITATKR